MRISGSNMPMGHISIGRIWCVCHSRSGTLNTATEGCRVAFPVAGESDTRAVCFEACGRLDGG